MSLTTRRLIYDLEGDLGVETSVDHRAEGNSTVGVGPTQAAAGMTSPMSPSLAGRELTFRGGWFPAAQDKGRNAQYGSEIFWRQQQRRSRRRRSGGRQILIGPTTRRRGSRRRHRRASVR